MVTFYFARWQLQSEVYYTHGLTLRNNSSAVLSYDLTSPPPFCVVQLDRATRQPVSRLNRVERCVLEPRHITGVNVAFCLSPDLLKYVHSLEFLEGPSPDGVELMRTEAGPSQLQFRLPLNMEFSNGSVQTVPLSATVTLPTLRLSRDTLDFGVCFIGQARELSVIIFNPTGSDSYWQCKQSTSILMLVSRRRSHEFLSGVHFFTETSCRPF